RLVGAANHAGGGLARAECGDTQVGHGIAVAGAGLAQVVQVLTDLFSEAIGIIAVQTRRKEGEFATTAA
ncbi:hypothetical protein P8629_12705, partial [Hydrogenovibrio sp. 3SP14C1]